VGKATRLTDARFRLAPRSLRWRLQLWQGFLVIAMMSGFGATIYQLQKVNRLRQADAELETRVTALSRAVRDADREMPPPHDRGRGPGFGPRDYGRGPGPPPRDHRPPPPDDGPPDFGPPVAVTLPPETAALFGPAAGYYFVIWVGNGMVLNQSSNAPGDSEPPTFSDRDAAPEFRTRGEFREVVHCTGLGECAMAGRSIQADVASLRSLAWTLTGAGAAVVILGFGLGWWLIGRAIRPVEQIGRTATRIAQGNLSERIDVGDLDDELGRLAGVLNSTFARLESAFARQRQFTSDAAHELRTPLAILISEAQTTLARDRTAGEYRETVEGALETAQQMRKLTEMLLELARFDTGDAAVSRRCVDLADSADRGIERSKSLAEPRGVAIHSNLSAAEAFTVPERVETVIANLLAKAIYYNHAGGEVRVSTRSENGYGVLEVADTGAGIHADDLPHIFDRFYRADKARTRSAGHAGLGLAICKTIVDAERGRIDVVSSPGAGSTFTVRFPAE
jgi:two-component system, OmpR family, sensor kinase